MSTEPNTEGQILPLPAEFFDATAGLRKAASEALLAGALLLAEVQRSTDSSTYGNVKPREERFTKALEALREALSS